jgi:hypothetical protein
MSVTVQQFEADRDLIVVGGQADVVDEHGRKLSELRFPTSPDRFRAMAFFRTPIAHPAAAMRLASLASLGARYGIDFVRALPDHQSLTVKGLAEDYYLFGQLSLLGRCTNVDCKLIKYRWHPSNIGSTSGSAQLEMALRISRFLAEALCVAKGVRRFDPTPFTNHGNAPVLEERVDFSEQFALLATSLRQALGPSEGLERELLFRRLLSKRRAVTLATRYLTFRLQHRPEISERLTLRSALITALRFGHV